MSEEELYSRIQTRKILKSGGDYGCGCLVFEGTVRVSKGWLDDTGFDKLHDALPEAELQARWGHADIGTIAVLGDLIVDGDLELSDRLMCLVVTGSLQAEHLNIHSTEVRVNGDLQARALRDHDNYLSVGGARRIG